MNKNIKLAVAGAVLALSASAANAGIVIPAGEWTLDIGGNVNMYSSWSKQSGKNTITGGLVSGSTVATTQAMGNGLLPNFLSVSGSTRQNDLDVGFTISLQPSVANNRALTSVTDGGSAKTGNGGLNNRQSFITFGDKSWGSIKVGKDLGIFGSDAILSDMTLLGVGAGATSGGMDSIGRIGSGYIYADWKPQIAYTTPNLSGFQATVGISQAWAQQSTNIASSVNQANVAYEGKASYSFAANDVTGKVWVSGIAQKQNLVGGSGTTEVDDIVAYAGDIGANVNVAGFGLTAYGYHGTGIGTTGQFVEGYALVSNNIKSRDSYGGYLQATYVLPTKTKIGISWGESVLDLADGETGGTLVDTNSMTTVGIYHPLTKHLNLVAEYSNVQSDSHATGNPTNTVNTGSLGAILFF